MRSPDIGEYGQYYTFQENTAPVSINLVFGDDASLDTFTYQRSIDVKKLIKPVKSFMDSLKAESYPTWSVASTAVSTVKNVVNYSINRSIKLSANFVTERTYNQATTILSNVTSALGAVGMGFLAGGPVGAVTAAVGTIISSGVQTYQAYDQQNIQVQNSNLQTAFMQSRLKGSLTDWGRGTSN